MMAISRRGQPLHFLILVLGGWTAMRVLAAISFTSVEPNKQPRPTMNIAAIAPAPGSDAAPFGRARIADAPTSALGPTPQHNARFLKRRSVRTKNSITSRTTKELLEYIRFSVDQANKHYSNTSLADFPPGAMAPFFPNQTGRHGRANRWSADFWLLARDGNADGLSTTVGRLGASQAGLRVNYRLTGGRTAPLAAYGRISAAIDSPHQAEAAAGFAIQPSERLPFSAALERRIAIGPGGRNAFALVTAAQIGPVHPAPPLRIEGYVQAGMVGFNRNDLFMDGRLAILHELISPTVSAGASVSGGAQPQLHRLDIGPAIEYRLPAKPAQIRLIAEWRQRVEGNVRPASGPALTLAANF